MARGGHNNNIRGNYMGILATATISKATTASGRTHRYLLVVVARGAIVYSAHITTSRAKALGFRPLGQGGRGQVVHGTWYATQGQFGV